MTEARPLAESVTDPSPRNTPSPETHPPRKTCPSVTCVTLPNLGVLRQMVWT